MPLAGVEPVIPAIQQLQNYSMPYNARLLGSACFWHLSEKYN